MTDIALANQNGPPAAEQDEYEAQALAMFRTWGAARRDLKAAHDRIDDMHRMLAASDARNEELRRTNEHLREQCEAAMRETVAALTEGARLKAMMQIGTRAMSDGTEHNGHDPTKLSTEFRPRPVS